jgi:hypothetical protein
MIIIPGPSGGGGQKRVAPDADDQLVWLLDESAAPFVNAGALGASGNLGNVSGSPRYEEGGLFKKTAPFFPYSGSVRHVISGAAGVTPSGSNLSASLWYRPFSHADPGLPQRHLLLHEYRNDDTWTAPFVSFGLRIESDANLRLGCYLAISGELITCATPNNLAVMSAMVWHHFGITYDQATLKFYVDGALFYSVAQTGAIDWGAGQWVVGGTRSPGAGIENAYSQIQDVRIANVIRPASYFADVWRKGIGWG